MGVVAKSQAGSFEAAMEVYYPRLVRRLTLVVRDPHEAEDLAQATMLRAHKSWAQMRDGDIGGWLFTTGTRLAINELRRRRRWLWRAPEEADATVEISSDPDLWKALGALDRRERAALVLNVLEGYTQAEIAQHLAVPPGTVASWISRGKDRLREQLKETVSDG